MDSGARQSYLEAQILTATPQKMRLMLIEAALGAARQTLELWDQQRNSEAVESLIRCRNIISELLSAIRPDESELTRRVMGIYVFLFKALTEAQLRRDRTRVTEAIRVLEIEQETWRQVCQQVPHAVAPHDGSDRVAPLPPPVTGAPGDPEENPPAGGFLLDA